MDNSRHQDSINQQYLFELDERKPTHAELWASQQEKHSLDEISAAMGTLQYSDKFFEALEFMARFRKYSPFNAFLMYVQNPSATFALTASHWLSDFDRKIRPGAVPLILLQPMGPVMFLFDVTDTDGAPLPELPQLKLDLPENEISGKLLDNLIECCKYDGIRVTRAQSGSQLGGVIYPTETIDQEIEINDNLSVPVRYELVISEHLDNNQSFISIVHELSHLYCGHIGSPDARWWPDRLGLGQLECEFEASAAAWLICSRMDLTYGLDSTLEEYSEQVQQIPQISIECIINAVSTIERMAKGQTKIRKKSNNS